MASPRPTIALVVGGLLAAGLAGTTAAAARAGDGAPVATPPPPALLSCPARYDGTEDRPVVPTYDAPDGFDPGDALAPAQAPTRALVCRYDAGHSSAPAAPPRPLTEQVVLTEGLEQMAADLTGAPRAQQIDACTLMDGPITRQLLGLGYPTGTVWVSATDEVNACVLSSNGDFSAGGGVGQQVAKAVADGGWVVPTQGERPVCGGSQPVGRAGVERELVPGEPEVMWVCRVDSDVPGPSSGTFAVLRADRPRLLAALRALHTRAASGDLLCVDDTADRWQVEARYERGAPVVLDVTTGACGPGGVVSNGALEADVSDEVVALLRRTTTQP
ncbi:hypothetical protein EEW87_011255 [Janibacter melonis]|uniref:DUF3558 domain-containing protein n=1 Tax=Janibacter melonis TaxID=262209 RepID=A0A5P8FPU2_9MICO|nr:hypothetical protein [Janibacter melonis]QFQ30752.2 hypothetical protein EEW87_011255 [Janibacter melonis]